MSDVIIRALASESEAWSCADLMASTDPWITLGRTREHMISVVTNPQTETHVAEIDEQIAGVIVIAMNAPVVRGYIMSLAVAPNHRNQGIGRRLLTFAEERIYRQSPNVFLCVSSFNTDAQRFYERHGYVRVGELTNHIIEGASEFLMRKSRGSLTTYKPGA